MRRWQKALPPLVSAGLIAWLVVRISPGRLAHEAGLLDWPRLAVATAALVIGLFLWDAFCLRWLFSRLGPAVSYTAVLQGRGSSYLLGSFNYELGQGMLAWQLARAQGVSAARTLAGCVLLACHDITVLLCLGLAGSLLSNDERAQATQQFCLAGLGILVGLGLIWTLVGKHVPVGSARWDWRRAGTLCLLRLGYYGLIVAYAAAGLHLCGVVLDFGVVSSAVPLVLLADGLPISVSGLGTRETALLYLLRPEQPAVLLAFSLTWSAGLMAGRLALGLACWWLPRLVAPRVAVDVAVQARGMP